MNTPSSRPMHDKKRLEIKTKYLTGHSLEYDSVIFHANWVQVNKGDQTTWFPVCDIIDVFERYHLPPPEGGVES
ncbi:MAG: hypothetical protein Q8N95_09570 [Desulfobacterales bacterium]|nr:hypothetical protein [Desulfobacterales bacterium]